MYTMWLRAVYLLPWVFVASTATQGSKEVIVGVNDYDRSAGKPLGMMPYCPGFNKSAGVTDEYLNKHFSVVVQSGWSKRGKIYRKRYRWAGLAAAVASDPHVDLRKRTMIALVESPLQTNMDAAYQTARVFSRIGFNAITVTTKPFTHARFAVTCRLAKVVGNLTALFIRDLMREGLDPAELVVVGGSLGAHIAGYAGKYLHSFTGQKIGHIMAVDPLGLCFRYAEPEDRLDPTDADFVQAIHSNMFGYGMEQPVGHVDFYLNGGVYQSAWFAPLPCLSVCSHVKVFFIFYYTIKYPGKFRAAKCDSVEQARNAGCFNNTPDISNTVGLSIDKNITGLFYLSTLHLKPYFMPDYKRDITKEFLYKINPNGTMIIDENTVFGYDYSTDVPKDIYSGSIGKAYDYTTDDPRSLHKRSVLNNLLMDMQIERTF